MKKTRKQNISFLLFCINSIFPAIVHTIPTTPPSHSQIKICPPAPQHKKKRKSTSTAPSRKSRKLVNAKEDDYQDVNILNQPTPLISIKNLLAKLEMPARRVLFYENLASSFPEIQKGTKEAQKLIRQNSTDKELLSEQSLLFQQGCFAYLFSKNQLNCLPPKTKIPYLLTHKHNSSKYLKALEYSTALPFQKNLINKSTYTDVTIQTP